MAKPQITYGELRQQLLDEIKVLQDILNEILNQNANTPITDQSKISDWQRRYNGIKPQAGAQKGMQPTGKDPESPEVWEPLVARDRRARVSC